MSLVSQLEAFESSYSFSFDPFQRTACESIARGDSVLVCAPTGSGKTVVGEFAVWLVLQTSGKVFYTTPLKALSNQKFGDLVRLHGADQVGLLTGDNSINASAPVVVMTTEVLRNMIYARSDMLRGLKFVVLDEVHYLQDRYRGAVWEEVIIHLPAGVKLISLSATLSNSQEFADWLETIRGPTRVVTETKRMVDLQQTYLVDGELYPMFVGEEPEREPNPEIQRLEGRSNWNKPAPRPVRGRHGARRRPPGRRLARRADVARLLRSSDMLPAIYFIFSRKGCDAAVEQCMRDGVRLTSEAERKEIRQTAEARCGDLDSADLDLLGYDRWVEALSCGLAPHHAGLIPVFKETVEDLFQKGLVKIAFATETLSLGINMPARTVVIESLSKFTGERHEVLTPGQYTQLTGRAGRRGIDTHGYAVVLQQPDLPFRQIAGLASARSFPLVSSFMPSYNMATNLVRNYRRAEAEHLLNSSFAQYRADKGVVIIEQMIERNEEQIAGYLSKMQCERGDFEQYWDLEQHVDRLQRSVQSRQADRMRTLTEQALAAFSPGQVWSVRTNRVKGRVGGGGAHQRHRGESRAVALTESTRLVHLGVNELKAVPQLLGSMDIDKSTMAVLRKRQGRRLDHALRRRLAAGLRRFERKLTEDEVDLYPPAPAAGEDDALAEARREMTAHPCHECPERKQHAKWAQKVMKLRRENGSLHKQVNSKTQTLSRHFERILGVLEEFGYLEDFSLTDKGHTLTEIYNENDLLIAETLARGWLDELEPSELAALISVFVYESRGPVEITGTLPSVSTKKAYGKVVRLQERVARTEQRAGLELTRGTETGFAPVAFAWCEGEPLEEIVDEDFSPGDFIRSCKQTIDLLRQVEQAATGAQLRKRLGAAGDGLNRGVVSYSAVSW
ncbi:MAG: DEAD/DEAH box helicase [Actinomycetota bacterium]